MIFGIGLAKTGTTSLCKAVAILGFKSKHYLTPEEYKKIHKYECVCDMPIQTKFRELDRMFPGSKFILTIRDINSWLQSCKNWFNKDLPKKYKFSHLPILEYRIEQFGIPYFDENIFREVYHNHNESVLNYFKQRPKDLLIMNICAGDGWEILCPFLNKPIPKKPFPRENVGGEVHWLTKIFGRNIQIKERLDSYLRYFGRKYKKLLHTND